MLPSLRMLLGAEMRAIHFGWLSVVAAGALSLLGIYLIDVASAPPPESGLVTMNGETLKQCLAVFVSAIAGCLVLLPHHRFLRPLAWPALIVCLLLLVFVLIPSVPVSIVRPQNGARAWITILSFNLQPSELTKIAYILVLAAYLRAKAAGNGRPGLIVPGLLTLLPLGLIIKQPDLGTAVLFIPAVGAMLIAAGASLRLLGIIVLAGVLAAPLAYPHLQEHQKRRIEGLLLIYQGSTEGRDDINFQYYTAMTVAGSGGISGNTDTKARALVRYNALPEAHTDMIFAVLCARFGMLGAAAVFGLYLLWLFGAAMTAVACRDLFGRYAIIGFCAVIGAQMFINIGMNIGLTPIIGITLPFLSAGGSSMLTVWIMTGLILNFAIRPGARTSG